MVTYRAPLDEIRFVLYELLDYESTVASLPGYEDGTPDIVDAILEEGAKFCENELLPLNLSGDAEGCSFENGVVRTPKGFKQAYDAFVAAGWTGLSCDPEFGGQGLPKTLQVLLDEFVCSTNLSFGTYPGLSHGAYNVLELHGTEAQKRLYLPRLVDGTWSGTMCLTEPHCGTDLGLIRTRAEPDGDGYRITGTKIFISAGEHDLTENIVHLVLAKLPDAPPGISLFTVPKFLVGADGAPGPRNGVACGAIEHKMGIKASSTCVMNFDGAQGELVGEPHKGMRYMFTMMNAARLAVGVQGLGLAETAYQSAVAYARERLQGRSLKGPRYPDKPADPIIVHPDIRKKLLTMRAYTEAARALAIWTGMELDIAARHPDAQRRAEADDLVGRKMSQHAGRALRRFFHPVAQFIEANMEDARLTEFVMPLAKSFARLQQTTLWIAQEGLRDRDQVGAAASDYLRFFALVTLAYIWARKAKIALERPNGHGPNFYDAKLATARFYMKCLLPQTSSLATAIMAGAEPVMNVDEDWF